MIHEGEFIHPLKLEGRHAALRCDQCHGGAELERTCAGCHTRQADFLAGRLAAFEGFRIEADPMADLDCTDCHDLSQPTEVGVIAAKCVDCHDEEYADMLGSWNAEVDQLLPKAEAGLDAQGSRLLDLLRQAGPLHNIEATRVITAGLATAKAESPTPDTAPARERE